MTPPKQVLQRAGVYDTLLQLHEQLAKADPSTLSDLYRSSEVSVIRDGLRRDLNDNFPAVVSTVAGLISTLHSEYVPRDPLLAAALAVTFGTIGEVGTRPPGGWVGDPPDQSNLQAIWGVLAGAGAGCAAIVQPSTSGQAHTLNVPGPVAQSIAAKLSGVASSKQCAYIATALLAAWGIDSPHWGGQPATKKGFIYALLALMSIASGTNET